ncbi:MAG: SUMF1/EgtB/PvdO family nonheme iron enzyme [Bacillota bacterium]
MSAVAGLGARLEYLFRSTKGLVLLAVGLTSLVTAVWGMLSGPAIEWGIKDVVVRVLGMRLIEAEREGRIIILYHALAMPVMAILVYLITDVVRMKPRQRSVINTTVTAAYLLVMFGGLGFAYFGRSWLLHAVFLFGLALMFYGGCLLASALWPWSREYRVRDPAYAHTRSGVDLERTAFFTMTLAALGSALFGAAAGAYYGNGFQTFLAENIIRETHKSVLQYAVIGHLHIMVALVAVGTTLVIGRWYDFKGLWHKLAMPLMIFGTVLLTLGVWGVVTPLQPVAHTIIYVGATPAMLAALFLIFHGWPKIIRERLAEQGLTRAGFGRKLAALLHDPLKFGVTWQMVFMNFTVSGVGIFMAVTLNETMRVWFSREERITLTGHWHILSVLTASIILFYVADQLGLAGRARKWFGWLIILGSDLAFAAVTVFGMKRLFVSEYAQQPVVDLTMILTDVGLILFLAVLASFLVCRLVDLFKAEGRWRAELAEAGLEDEDTPPDPGGPARTRRRKGADVTVATLVLAIAVLAGAVGAGGCAAPAVDGDWPPVFDTGVSPGTWTLVPAGGFLSGQFLEPTAVEADFEIMVTPVTNAEYAAFLNEALAAGYVRVSGPPATRPAGPEEGAVDFTGGFTGDRVEVWYPGDEFHGYKHEKRVDAGWWLVMPLGEPVSRILFDGESFSVRPGYERHPVTMVTWFGAKAFCDFRGWRLPTELEWEKAARGTDGRPYPWGDGIGPGYANYYKSRDPFERKGRIGDTTPVGFYNGRRYGGFETADSRSPYGLYDAAGNVGEWTGNVYAGTHLRYVRGGRKGDYGYDLRVWTRFSALPTYASPSVGFRCVRTPASPDGGR